MKKIVFLFGLTLFTLQVFAGGDQIKSFDLLMDLLKAGKDVKVVIHYGKCRLISDNEISEYSPDAIGGMTIDTWEYFAENAVRNKHAFVVTSTTHLIANPIGEGYVLNYVKIKIEADQKIKITARYLDPVSYEVKMDENFFTDLNEGNNEGAVYFYEMD
ncbi:MAG: VirK family protein [Bacteroidales bacterium]